MNKQKSKKGQVGTIVGYVVAIILIALLGVGVGLKVLNDSATDGNFTGTTKTVVDNLPVIAAVGFLILIIAYFYFKSK